MSLFYGYKDGVFGSVNVSWISWCWAWFLNWFSLEQLGSILIRYLLPYMLYLLVLVGLLRYQLQHKLREESASTIEMDIKTLSI